MGRGWRLSSSLSPSKDRWRLLDEQGMEAGGLLLLKEVGPPKRSAASSCSIKAGFKVCYFLKGFIKEFCSSSTENQLLSVLL